MLSLESPARKGGPWLVLGKEFPLLPADQVTCWAQTVGTNDVAYAERPLSFWEPGVLMGTRQRMSMGPAPNKTPAHGVSSKLPGG